VAGEICAKYLAPKDIYRIGVFGTGVQARMQVEYLKSVTDCKDIIVWGRNRSGLDAYQRDMKEIGYAVQTTQNAQAVAESCNLIVTATAAKNPLLHAGQIRKGTHITAMGSDTLEKQELDPKILQTADIVVADSIEQCLLRGEIHKALEAGLLNKEDIFELGNVIIELKSPKRFMRRCVNQIADHRGVKIATGSRQLSRVITSGVAPWRVCWR
jgi:ornithine cyclodeaminase